MQLKRFGFPQIMFNAENEGGGGSEVVQPENVLFPDEKAGADSGENNAESAGKEGADGGAGDWKEYENDPAKTPEENAAAKAEHDKSKPAADDKNDPANKVPEDGKYELTMPDGVELDTELADALGPDFKELNLTNAQAQKLVDKYISIQQERAAGQSKVWGDRVQKWADDAKADKEIGGDKWQGTVIDAQRAINKLGTPALKEYLNASGGGNHPELIRILAKAGALLKEDNPPGGDGKGSGQPVDAAHRLFPNDAPKG